MSSTTFIVSPHQEEEFEKTKPANLSTHPIFFLDFVAPDLKAIEARMNSDLGSDVRTVYSLTNHILNAGGKRLRPAMVALSARAVSADIDPGRLADIGAAVEFVHMATLIHDDVVDNTATRRGLPTANAVYGNGVAVLSGDYMLARAMRLLAMDGDLKIIRTVSEITIEMSEGEVMEISATGNSNLSLEDYLEILRKKTATFVEGCCRCGAILAGANEAAEDALAHYGYRLGMAFQIADDLLDYTGDPLVTGKPRGSDLKDGRATLPFMLGLKSGSETQKEILLRAFANDQLSDGDVLDICEILEGLGAFEQTRIAAADQVEKSETALDCLPPSTAKDCFTALTSYVVQREK